MTATATSASRKRTSGLRTSQRTRNIWRASKLGGKTRPTNWSNIFRWYRSSWEGTRRPIRSDSEAAQTSSVMQAHDLHDSSTHWA